jgi:hypothetical protein
MDRARSPDANECRRASSGVVVCCGLCGLYMQPRRRRSPALLRCRPGIVSPSCQIGTNQARVLRSSPQISWRKAVMRSRRCRLGAYSGRTCLSASRRNELGRFRTRHSASGFGRLFGEDLRSSTLIALVGTAGPCACRIRRRCRSCPRTCSRRVPASSSCRARSRARDGANRAVRGPWCPQTWRAPRGSAGAAISHALADQQQHPRKRYGSPLAR